MQGKFITTRLKLVLLTGSVLAVICLTGYADYKSNQKIAASEILVKHTEQVIYEVAAIFSLTKDMQEAMENFVITQDSGLLSPFYSAQSIVFPEMARLRELTKDNVSQLPRIDSLERDIRQALDFSQRIIFVREEKGLQAAAMLIATHEGQTLADRIRQLTSEIQLDEKLLLTEEQQINEQSVARLKELSIGMFILMVAFTLLLFVITNNYLTQQEKFNRETEIWNAELVRANTALEAFSYSVSHDLRSPVRSIIGFSKIINEKHGQNLGDKVRLLFSHIESSGKRMNIIIDDLLALARSGTQELHAESIDITALFNRIWGNLLFASPHRATLSIQQISLVRADSSMLEQVIVNLLSNAIKYSGKCKEPLVTVGHEQREGRVIVFVRDNGAGFDMKHYDRLFGAFQRLHVSSEFEGIGIGLMLVKRIIERQGGEVWAEGKIDEGATFYFSLPAA